MPNNLAVMRMALRVLSAMTDGRPPHTGDVAALRRLAPSDRALPVDELAYRVIQQELRSREHARVGPEGQCDTSAAMAYGQTTRNPT